MSAGTPPKKNAAYTLVVGLVDQSNTKKLKADPTLAAGDFKISIDFGAFANLAALPTVPRAGHPMVEITLSVAEMNGDDITIECIDAAGDEWCDQIIHIKTSSVQIGESAANDTASNNRLRAFLQSILGV